MTTSSLPVGVRLYAGARLSCESPVHFAPGAIVMSSMRIGAYSYFGEGCLLGSAASVGRFCSFAPGVKLGLGKHPMHYLSTHPFFFRSPGPFAPGLMPDGLGVARTPEYVAFAPEVGNDVWVGANAVIVRGVKIGHGAVIGAGSVVTKDVRPYAVAAGSPAKEIRRRFDDATCERLLALRWWDFDPRLLVGVDVCDVPGQIDRMEQVLQGQAPAAYELKETVGPVST